MPDHKPDPGVELAWPDLPTQTIRVDGWEIPFTTAKEVDGGRIQITLDNRLGFEVSAADFDQVARLLANAIAIALGIPSWPGNLDDEEHEKQHHWMGHLPHLLRPRRVFMVTGVNLGGDDA